MFVPQVVAAVVTIAGIGALAGSALMLAFPGNQAIYATALIVLSAILVISGQYQRVEQAASVMAGILIVAVIVAVPSGFPRMGRVYRGLVPGIGDDFDLEFLLPWLGFILAGAAGIMWFSYWVAAREYGGPVEGDLENDETSNRNGSQDWEDEDLQQRRRDRLKKWLRVMSTTAAIGVVGGGLVIIAFLVLGAELLRPEGIIPEGIRVAEDLTTLLSEVWGEFGYWLLLGSIAIALGGTIVANQDGCTENVCRCYPHPQRGSRNSEDESTESGVKGWLKSALGDRDRLKNIYVVITVTLLPLIVFFLVRDPVDILEVGGIVAAAHQPVVAFLTLYLNQTKLPEELKPGWLSSTIMVLSGTIFYHRRDSLLCHRILWL
uniref:Divalent metal cation transporter n=1 Tax=Desertifilum tharense IPPAS B-1220 TaxID=1781255 RepID=A0ACD5H254_9CYAN